MKRYTPEELSEVLRLHLLWLWDEEEGVRANLSGSNLSRSNLSGADLSGANLSGADLFRANLSGANGVQNIICVGPIGSRNAYTTYWIDEDRVQCGCWKDYRGGSVDEFEERVREVHTGKHLAEYLAAIAMFRAIREAQPAKGEVTQTEQVIA